MPCAVAVELHKRKNLLLVPSSATTPFLYVLCLEYYACIQIVYLVCLNYCVTVYFAMTEAFLFFRLLVFVARFLYFGHIFGIAEKEK